MNQLYFLLLLLTLSACSFEEKDLFDKPAAERIADALTSYDNILQAAPNGWIVDYFPTDTTEGYTFLMKFDKNTKVLMAAKNRWINNVYTLDSCIYSLGADYGPVLSFPVAGNYIAAGTQIGIFHLFANPQDPRGGKALDGYGLGGDYEFVIDNATDSTIMLLGKKTKAAVRMYKAPLNMPWRDVFVQLDAMRASIIGTSNFPLSMVVDKDTFVLKNDSRAYGAKTAKFRIYPKGGNTLLNGTDFAYIFTLNGLRFHTPMYIGNELIANFTLSADKTKLISENKNIKAYIYGSNPVDYILSNNVSCEFVFSEPMGSKMKVVYDKIVLNCKTKYKENFSNLYFRFDVTRGSYSLIFKSGKYTGVFDFTRTSSVNGHVFLNYKGTKDTNAGVYYTNIPGFEELVSYLSQSFRVETYGGMSSRRMKLTSTVDPEINFILTI